MQILCSIAINSKCKKRESLYSNRSPKYNTFADCSYWCGWIIFNKLRLLKLHCDSKATTETPICPQFFILGHGKFLNKDDCATQMQCAGMNSSAQETGKQLHKRYFVGKRWVRLDICQLCAEFRNVLSYWQTMDTN